MLRKVKEITGYMLQATDGEIGHCKDFLVDDEHWAVRYMVADTARWLTGSKVLLSPVSLGEPVWDSRLFPVRLTREQIQKAPNLDEHAPVSRRHEIEYQAYYGWPSYWSDSVAWAAAAERVSTPVVATEDRHLRSVHELIGYHIRAKDGEVGHVDDFLVDDKTWDVRYVVVATRNWLPGRKVLISPRWIESVNWGEREVKVLQTRLQIKDSPKFVPERPVSREYEGKLHDFYGRPPYWD